MHDPADDVVPLLDSYLIAAELSADVHETVAGVGHHRIIGSEEMRVELAACLRPHTTTS